MVKNAFDYAFFIATLPTTGGEEIEVNNHCGDISTIMRILTNKDGHLLSYSDKIGESQNGNKGSSLNQILIDNHEQVANRGKIKGQLSLEQTF